MKNNKQIPFCYESEGMKKIVSILHLLRLQQMNQIAVCLNICLAKCWILLDAVMSLSGSADANGEFDNLRKGKYRLLDFDIQDISLYVAKFNAKNERG